MADGLTEEHRRLQLALRAGLLRELLVLWGLWRTLEEYELFVRAATILIRDRARISAGLAASYLEAFAGAQGLAGPPELRVAEPPPPEQITRSLFATGLVAIERAMRAGQLLEQARSQGFVAASGAAGRLTLLAGRQTLVDSTIAEPRFAGWRRVTGASPCEFCRMLAGRGAVYTAATVEFRAHDHCACSAEPALAEAA